LIVDAHQHFWDPATADYPWMTDDLRRRYGPDDLAPLLDEYGVRGTIVVQARHSSDETRQLLEIAAATPFVLGVVGWVDLTGDVEGALDGLVGVRHQVEDEPDPDWLLRKDVQRGIAASGEAGIVFDLLVQEPQLPAAVEAVRRNPGTKFVLDHVAKRPAEDAGWAEGVAALADMPNVACKLSGLLTGYDPQGTAAHALDLFGADRCMFGSDWPVWSAYGDALALAGDDERVLAGTAIRTYGLEVA
jgi:L-fucono-1,5-lactonase